MTFLLPMHPKSTMRNQGGSALVMVLFMIVVLGSLAAFGLRNIERSSDAIMHEVVGTRADMAARSGAQLDISALYQTTDKGSCLIGNQQTYTFTGAGLNNCEAKVSCAVIGVNKREQTVYRLESEGFCTVGDQKIKRAIEVGLLGDEKDNE
ncbi:MSHA biogenesis protein MshP [Photobacterium profundum]|nr:MSHA biogenesis protein MshP [Photobacterium profundum]